MSDPKTIGRVCVVGGTHGNEWTGAYLARHWQRQPEALAREGLEVEALLANPQAFAITRRYQDKDLNRCFSEAVQAGSEGGYERARAAELKAALLAGHTPDEVAIFDLHTTTAHMGKSLVLSKLTTFNVALCAWLKRGEDDVRLYRWVEEGEDPGFLSSVADAGFAIEVGPVANAVLDPTMIGFTRDLVHACLDFTARWADPDFRAAQIGQQVVVHTHVAHVDYPRDEDGLPSAYVHPDRMGTDFQPLHKGDPLFLTFGGDVIAYDGDEGRVPVFINECAYYEKGIAMTLTEAETLTVGEG
jgi:aspartoacylase